MFQLISLFEKGIFSLDNIPKVILLEGIPDCLGCDRVGNSLVDEMGGLHSIIEPPSGDLLNK
jgi:hypothetical protein